MLIIALVLVTIVGVGFVATRTRRTPSDQDQLPLPGTSEAAQAPTTTPVDSTSEETDIAAEPAVVVPPKIGQRIGRTRSAFGAGLRALVGRGGIDAALWEDIEDALLLADVGINTAGSLLTAVKAQAKEEGAKDSAAVLRLLKKEMRTRLSGDITLRFAEPGPSVWLFVGVNGVGKTTTIGKIGNREVANGKSVVMAAGDTFRAAAAEQLETWAQRCGADLVRADEGADPSSVIFDAIARAHARNIDLVLADTAGRLHTKSNLMDELRKVRRVAEKGEGTVTETLLVLDATTGQNGLVQAREFTEAVEVTGVVLTKLDGSAKGGIVVAIESELGIPVKLVGLGESAEDLVDFDPDEFIDALFADAGLDT